MQFLKSTFGGLILVFILMAAILFARESRLFTAPNTWLIDDTYDGFRTFSAMVYHVKHDSTYSHYEGMNYPYGDKAAFTDNLPLVSNSVKFISRHLSDISDYCGGILNGFLLLSVLLCAVFTFLSFRALKLPVWYAVPIAIGITMLSPQLLRMSAHYGLAHPFVVPMVFWLSLLFHENKRWSSSLLIAFALFLCAQLHFYLFAIGAGFIAALMAFKTLFAFSKRALVINGLHLLVQIILPFIILQILMYDTVPDRPSRPFGFLAYNASWQSVFLPVDFQLGRWINEYVYKIPNFNREGIAYIGLVSLLFFFKEIILKLWNRIFKKEYHSILPEKHRFFLKSAFWACFAILLFSFGIPFIFPGFEGLHLKLGPLAQFRSIGRFAWVFFYVFNIIAFYALYFQFQKIRKRGWQTVGYLILLSILLTEGTAFLFDKIKLKLHPHPEIREAYQHSDNTWLDSIAVDDFQAILTVPFFHIGSENIWLGPRAKGMHQPMWASVQTGLPINSSFMGRTSVNHIINQMELIAEPYRMPKVLDELPNQKDFLIFVYKKAYKNVWHRYEHFLQNLEPLHENKTIKIYRLSIDEIKNRIGIQAQNTRKAYNSTKLFKYDVVQTSDSIRSFKHLNFDEQPAEKTYHGKGAFNQIGFPEKILFDDHLPFQQTEDNYVFSIWAYMQGDLNPKIKVWLEEYQAGTQHIIYRQQYELYKYFRSVDNGWILCEFPFKMQRPDSRLRVKVWNRDLTDRPVFLDELQIRKQGTKVFVKEGGNLIMNNRVFDSE